MNDTKTIEWLLENGGPIVRWRTANELCQAFGYTQPPIELERLKQELLAQPLVQAWLKRLHLQELSTPLEGLDADALWWLGRRVHGGKVECLENVLGKLAEFGLRAGMPGLDERALPLMRLFRWQGEWKRDVTFQNAWETLVKSVFAWGLLRLGYAPDAAMQDFLLQHVQVCHKIAGDRVYDIYADEAELAGLPKAWTGKPIIKQEVMANYWLPYIHDLYVFAHLPADLHTAAIDQMINELLDYLLDPRFQALPDGYGYAWIKERRTCYGWGWSPHLKDDTTRLLRIQLLAHFPHARQSAWFQESLQFLESFRTSEGRYCFPIEYLHESEGYYVTGAGMGLGESRRKSTWNEIESTFRMMNVKKYT